MKKQEAKSHKALAQNCDYVAGILKALAHPQRLMILCHLSQEEKTVGELQELCGASQSSVSQYLGRMRLEGLIKSEKRGQFVYYFILDARVKEMITALHRIFCR